MISLLESGRRMHLVYQLLYFLRQIFSLPANLAIWLWNQPARGRCLLYGLPAVVMLLLVLWTAFWARTGLRRDLTTTYRLASQKNEQMIRDLEAALTGQGPQSSSGDVNSNTENTDRVLDQPPEPEVSVASKYAREAMNVIQQRINADDIRKVLDNPTTVVDVEIDGRGRVSNCSLATPSGDSFWDQIVMQAVEQTEDLLVSGRSDMPNHLRLTFAHTQVALEKIRMEALIYLRKLVDLNPEDPQYKYQLALKLEAQGSLDRAAALMDQIAPLNRPGLPDAHIWRAVYIYRNSTNSTAAKIRMVEMHLKNALQVDPNHFDANYAMAELLVASKRYSEALVYLERIFNDSSNVRSLKVTQLMLACYQATNQRQRMIDRLAEVESRLRSFWEKDPTNESYLYDLQQVLLWENRQQDAIDLLLAHTTDENRGFVDKQLAAIYTSWAELVARQPDYDPAEYLAKLKKAIEYNPRYEQALHMLAVLITIDSPLAEEARKLYDPVADRAQAPPTVKLDYANYLIRLGRNDEAIEWLEEARQASPENLLIGNNLAYLMLSKTPPDPQRALELIDAVLQNAPNNAKSLIRSSLMDTKAAALIQVGKHNEAIPYLEEALRARPNELKILVSLRDCYSAIGQNLFVDKYQKRIDEIKSAPDKN